MRSESDKTRCHSELEKFGPYGTLSITGTGRDYEIVLRKIVKARDMTPEQQQAVAAVVKAFGSSSIRVISEVSKGGVLCADRVEALYFR